MLYDDDSIDYVRSRVNNSVVSIRNKIYKMVDVGGHPAYYVVFDLEESSDYKNFDIATTPLEQIRTGMTNFGDRAMYVSRRPKRSSYLFGLSRNNVWCWEKGSPHPGFFESDLDWRCLTGPHRKQYPTFIQTLELLNTYNEVFDSIAISREFAIEKDGKLRYRNFKNPVGKVNLGNGLVVLEPEAVHTRELLIEAVSEHFVR